MPVEVYLRPVPWCSLLFGLCERTYAQLESLSWSIVTYLLILITFLFFRLCFQTRPLNTIDPLKCTLVRNTNLMPLNRLQVCAFGLMIIFLVHCGIYDVFFPRNEIRFLAIRIAGLSYKWLKSSEDSMIQSQQSKGCMKINNHRRTCGFDLTQLLAACSSYLT